jgi:hypothetical protein
MARISRLTDKQAAHARELLVRSAKNMVKHKTKVVYSQAYNRQEAMRKRKTITRGEYPATADCSSTVWWMLWDAMGRNYKVKDIVCKTDGWNPNQTVYTGSMFRNGKAVVHDKNLKVGDLIFYGTQSGGIPSHVCMYIGGGLVFSHGSNAGPYICKLDYRSDRRMSRRYI